MTIRLSKTEINTIVNSIQVSQLTEIRQFVLFVGHAHSGHSIIGSILDAHQSIAFANEVNIVSLIRQNKLTKLQIESILLHYSFNNKAAKAWQNSEYIYNIDNSLQGQTKTPKVIGDKKAGGTTRIFYKHPWVLDYLLELYGCQLKFIFVKRNPVDIVAAYSYYMQQASSQFHIDRYKENYQTVKRIAETVGTKQFVTIQQESFINKPSQSISELLDFLDIPFNKKDVESWIKIVKTDVPSKSKLINIPTNLLRQLF